MIPLSTFNLMVAVMIVLFLYAIIDVKSKYYTNIAAAFICALISLYLFIVISVGVVQYDPCSDGTTTVITDASLGFILLIFTIAMMIFAALMAYDAYIEYKREQESII